MILKQEIQRIAREKKLGIDIIEKDYIIDWVLAGINSHPLTKSTWVFKGGTCLKKCYFETYRYSEDLDFTFIGSSNH
jgi:predicted nucleotidyltransferase component of viral defense system